MSAPRKKNIHYRKRALETASRPVVMDDAFQILSVRSWLALVIMGLVLVTFIAWLIWGSVFIRVSGKGILMSTASDITSVQAPQTPGTVSAILIKPGTPVKKGMVLARLDNTLDDEMQVKENYIRQLREVEHNLVQEGLRQIAIIEKNVGEQVGKSRESLQVAQEKLQQLKLLIDLKEKALSKGIIDLPNVTATRVEYYGYQQEISAREADLISVREKFVELRNEWRERERALNLQIYREEYEYHLLKQKWEMGSVVKSPVEGIVSEIRVQDGDYVTPGQILLSIIPADQDVYALVFIPATRGKLMQQGMPAEVVPTMVNRMEYGAIRGTVETFSVFPVTGQQVSSMVKNAGLVAFFGAETPMLAVHVRLKKNPDTPSGYDWTSSRGPDLKLTQGSLVDASITVEKIHPLGFLLRNLQQVFKESVRRQ